MKTEQIINKIKERGYWRIHFAPLSDEKLSLSQCREIVEKNSIQLRGWYYPHVPHRIDDNTAMQSGDKFWQGWINWENHIELWRLFQTGQFIHYLALVEDWTQDLIVNNMWDRDNGPVKSGEILSTLNTIYLITEIFQFLSRLATDGIYKNGVRISISLNKTDDRKLAILDYRRIPFSEDKKTIASEIGFEKSYTQKQLLEEPVDLAREAILHFFERFDWTPPAEQIKTDQEKLIERRT